MKQYIKNIMILILALPWGLLLTNCSDSESDYSDDINPPVFHPNPTHGRSLPSYCFNRFFTASGVFPKRSYSHLERPWPKIHATSQVPPNSYRLMPCERAVPLSFCSILFFPPDWFIRWADWIPSYFSLWIMAAFT